MTEPGKNIDRELLLHVAAGCEKAFSRLFHAYSHKLYSFIYNISKSSPIAEDTVQEVFLKIWQKRSELTHIREFDAYLFRMAHNYAVNAFKRVARETLFISEIARQPNSSTEIITALEFKEAQKSLQSAIEKLPSKQKEVFILSREHGLKQAEISVLLNITVPTVKSHITQAMHSIRKQCINVPPVTKIYFILATIIIN